MWCTQSCAKHRAVVSFWKRRSQSYTCSTFVGRSAARWNCPYSNCRRKADGVWDKGNVPRTVMEWVFDDLECSSEPPVYEAEGSGLGIRDRVSELRTENLEIEDTETFGDCVEEESALSPADAFNFFSGCALHESPGNVYLRADVNSSGKGLVCGRITRVHTALPSEVRDAPDDLPRKERLALLLRELFVLAPEFECGNFLTDLRPSFVDGGALSPEALVEGLRHVRNRDDSALSSRNKSNIRALTDTYDTYGLGAWERRRVSGARLLDVEARLRRVEGFVGRSNYPGGLSELLQSVQTRLSAFSEDVPLQARVEREKILHMGNAFRNDTLLREVADIAGLEGRLQAAESTARGVPLLVSRLSSLQASLQDASEYGCAVENLVCRCERAASLGLENQGLLNLLRDNVDRVACDVKVMMASLDKRITEALSLAEGSHQAFSG